MKYFFSAILFFLTANLFAADFPTGAQIEILSDWSGGLFTTSPRHKIPKNSSPSMSNVFVHRKPGQLQKRSGFKTVGSTNTLQGGRLGFTFYKEDGDKEYIVTDDSIVLTTKDYQFYTFIASGLNNTVHLNVCQARNKVWFTNGVDAVFTWDGTSKQILDGTNGTPNVPRFRYFAYYQERVFGFNTTANASLLQWSDLSSTAGVAIAPDSFLAWPVTNGLNIGQGDGQNGTALWVYKGQLQIGKERSIYTLYGDRTTGDKTSVYQARKTEQKAGVSSNDSVVVMDGLTYYKGFDGIYAYSGGESQRISDNMIPDVQAILDANVLLRQNVWETQTDFARGQFFGSTATPDGLLTISPDHFFLNYSTYIRPTPTNLPPNQFLELTSTGVQFTQFTAAFSTNTVPRNFYGYFNSLELINRSVGACSPQFDLTVTNTKTQQMAKFRKSPGNLGNNFGYSLFKLGDSENTILYPQPYIFFTSDELTSGKFQVQISTKEDLDPSCFIQFYPSTTTGFANIQLLPATTVQFMSEVSTVATVSAWSNFTSANNTGGGTINYFVRTATSAVNITTRTWSSITPGAIVGAPIIENYIQWATTITSVSSQPVITYIDDVAIEHVEGSGSSDRPFAIDWKNEYWLSVATDTTGKFSRQYVKSWVTNANPNAWNPLDGMNIRSLWRDGTTALYAGAASSGTFYRLDFGTNDDGRPIDAYYETPDLILRGGLALGMEGNWMDEQLHEIWIDADAETGNIFTLGQSLNGGAYSDASVSLTGSDRVLKVLYNRNAFAKYFRFRFRNKQLDKNLGLNNFAIVYIPMRTR